MLPDVKLRLVVNGHYEVVVAGDEVGTVSRVQDGRWRLRLNTDPENRNRRAFSSLKMMRQHILRMAMSKRIDDKTLLRENSAC